MNIFHKRTSVIALVSILIAILFFAINQTPINKSVPLPSIIPSQPSSPIVPVASSTTPIVTTSTAGTKTYRNTEFGFEFQYPENWKLDENSFGSPFSKFNLIGTPTEGDYLPDPFLLNVVTPDFADNAAVSRENVGATTSDIVVSGVKATKYEYKLEGLSTISVDVLFGQYRIILGAKNQYENVFNQILSTFKILK